VTGVGKAAADWPQRCCNIAASGVAHSPSSRCDAPTGAADCTNPDEKAMIDVSELVGVVSQRTGEAPSENPLIAGFLSGVRMMIALRVLPALSGVYNRLQRQPRFCDPHRPRWIIRCSAKASARSALPALPACGHARR
jgi:hypothetical protein